MRSVRVYIVEDDPMVADINRRMTEKIPPFKLVGISYNEKSGLAEIRRLQPDLVLLDIYLPGNSGLKLMQSIREEGLPCDVILITAAKDANTIYETLRYGAIDYIIKPFNLERLEKSLRNYLKLRSILSKKQEFTQEEIDKMNNGLRAPNRCETHDQLPKGVHYLTLNHIVGFLLRQNSPLSCQEIADRLSMSKITVWRYLEYLLASNKVAVELDYGVVGRPSKKYYISPD